MNILLTHGYFLHEDEKEKKIMRPYVPLGILYISAWLEKHGYDNEIFDSTFSSFDQLSLTIETNKPCIVAIYTNLMTAARKALAEGMIIISRQRIKCCKTIGGHSGLI